MQSLIRNGGKGYCKTHHELAYELGTAREVYPSSKNFEGYGWVNLKRGTVDIIDREALIRLCNKAITHGSITLHEVLLF